MINPNKLYMKNSINSNNIRTKILKKQQWTPWHQANLVTGRLLLEQQHPKITLHYQMFYFAKLLKSLQLKNCKLKFELFITQRYFFRNFRLVAKLKVLYWLSSISMTSNTVVSSSFIFFTTIFILYNWLTKIHIYNIPT